MGHQRHHQPEDARGWLGERSLRFGEERQGRRLVESADIASIILKLRLTRLNYMFNEF